METVIKELKKIIDQERIYINEPMKNHTYFKIGGPVDLLVEIESIEEIKQVLKIAKEKKIDYHIIGNGTNLLVKDEGVDGIVIKIGEHFNHYAVEGNFVIAQSGILLSTLAKKIAKSSLTGFEFASGIPGSLGGAIYMNAGAYGGEMKDIVKEVTLLDENDEIINLSNDEMAFGYRESIISRKNYIVLEVKFELEKGNYEDIMETIKTLDQKRLAKQPIDKPSAGSTFKRPEGHYAGKLIDDSGLRGAQFGDARVSRKHCGFVVNIGNATFNDVITLIEFIKKVVKDKFNVELEREVRILGRD